MGRLEETLKHQGSDRGVPCDLKDVVRQEAARGYGCAGVAVDAKPGAVEFYMKHGFVAHDPLEGRSEARPPATWMFLAMRAILAASDSPLLGARTADNGSLLSEPHASVCSGQGAASGRSCGAGRRRLGKKALTELDRWARAGADLTAVLGAGVAVRTVAHSPDKRHLLLFTTDRAAWIVAAGAGAPPRSVQEPAGAIHSAAWSPDGARVAVGGNRGGVWIYPVDGGTPVEPVRHADRVLTLSWSKDGARLCSGSADDTARVFWASGAFDPILLAGHTGDVVTCEFTHGGARVVTISGDGSTRLWSATTGAELLHIPGRLGPLQWLALAPDGKSAVTVSTLAQSRTVRFADWPELLDRLGAATTACLTAGEREQLLAEAKKEARSGAAACARRFGRTSP